MKLAGFQSFQEDAQNKPVPENIGIDSPYNPTTAPCANLTTQNRRIILYMGCTVWPVAEGAVMVNFDLSSFLAALVVLPEIFEKHPHGAMMVSGLVALLMVCWTIVAVKKRE